MAAARAAAQAAEQAGSPEKMTAAIEAAQDASEAAQAAADTLPEEEVTDAIEEALTSAGKKEREAELAMQAGGSLDMAATNVADIVQEAAQAAEAVIAAVTAVELPEAEPEAQAEGPATPTSASPTETVADPPRTPSSAGSLPDRFEFPLNQTTFGSYGLDLERLSQVSGVPSENIQAYITDPEANEQVLQRLAHGKWGNPFINTQIHLLMALTQPRTNGIGVSGNSQRVLPPSQRSGWAKQ